MLMLRLCSVRVAIAGAVVFTAQAARAQAGPLPPLPNDDSAGQSPPPAASQPVQPAQPAPVSAQPVPPPPPPIEYVEAPEPTHAPKFSLYVGGSLRFLGYGGHFYQQDPNVDGAGHDRPETTGNFVRNGGAFELDAGARLGRRYILFLFLEHGLMGKGHRFEGTDASVTSDLAGLGFRYVAGDVDSAGFLTEISVGLRTITVKNGSQTFKMSTPEIFRLGLGAEIRLSTLFTLSPMAHLSGGYMSDTDGDVTFAPNQGDNLTHPTYRNGASIDAQAAYLVVGLGCGGHFDVFGK